MYFKVTAESVKATKNNPNQKYEFQAYFGSSVLIDFDSGVENDDLVAFMNTLMAKYDLALDVGEGPNNIVLYDTELTGLSLHNVVYSVCKDIKDKYKSKSPIFTCETDINE